MLADNRIEAVAGRQAFKNKMPGEEHGRKGGTWALGNVRAVENRAPTPGRRASNSSVSVNDVHPSLALMHGPRSGCSSPVIG